MKEFNLKAALNGEPVMLRNGCKAIVYYKIPDKYVFSDGSNSTYPLRGLIFDEDGFIENTFYFWLEDGRCHRECYKSNDIIGMWEEPELTSEQVLEKAYSEDLIVCWENNDGEFFEGVPVAKTKDGRYLFKDCCDFFPIDNEGGVWLKEGAQTTKSDTITVTLPKPFKPKEGELYYCIDLRQINGILETNYMSNYLADRSNLDNGQCFKSESDAKAWLGAMKNALDD